MHSESDKIIEAATAARLSSGDRDHLQWMQACGFSPSTLESILDLGCGGGGLVDHLAAKGVAFALGVDIIKQEGKPLHSNAKWMTGDFDDAAWPLAIAKHAGRAQFSLVTCFDIIEHLESPRALLESCRSLIAPGGKLLLTTPNVNSWERLLRPKTWSGSRDPQHKLLFTSYSLQFLLERSGYVVEKIYAPVRALGEFARFMPQIGGQLCVTASVIKGGSLRSES